MEKTLRIFKFILAWPVCLSFLTLVFVFGTAVGLLCGGCMATKAAIGEIKWSRFKISSRDRAGASAEEGTEGS